MNHLQSSELILSLVRANSDESLQAHLQGLSESDWSSIFRQSLRHCIAPLVYHRLKTTFRDVRLPAGAISRLKDANLYFTARNIRFYHELGRLLQNLNDSVPVILLKGGHLAAFVYRDISLRLMVDLDILARKADLHKINKVMEEMGYTRSMEYPDHPYHVAYLDPTKSVLLEVHWHICSETVRPMAINIDDLWRDARSEVLKGSKIRVLRPEHLLLHICMHDAGQHFYQCGLRTFCDIDAIIGRYQEEFDWELIVSVAHQWGITKSSYLTLLLAKELMSANVPEGVLAALKPPDFRLQNLSWAKQAIFAPLSQDEPVSEHFAQFWGADRYKSKIAFFLANVFPHREVMAKIYSVPPVSPYIYLYYPWRLIELSMRYGRSFREIWKPGSEVRTGLEAEHSRILLREWLQS